jgi:hypothetical protein
MKHADGHPATTTKATMPKGMPTFDEKPSANLLGAAHGPLL